MKCDKVFIADERENNFLKTSRSAENKGFSVGTLIIEQWNNLEKFRTNFSGNIRYKRMQPTRFNSFLKKETPNKSNGYLAKLSSED